MMQPHRYHEIIYNNLTKANERRALQLEQERLYHKQILNQYEDALVVGEIQGRRTQFRNFVADKLRQEKFMREVDEEHFHLDYLTKIKKLREEREKLQRQMKLDRVSLLENRSNEKITKDKSLVTSYIYNTQRESPVKNQSRPLNNYGSVQPEKRETLFYNDQLAKKIQERWAPYDKKEQVKRNELDYDEKYMDDLNEKLQKLNIKSRKMPKEQAKDDEGSYSHDHEIDLRRKSKKNVSFHIQKQQNNQSRSRSKSKSKSKNKDKKSHIKIIESSPQKINIKQNKGKKGKGKKKSPSQSKAQSRQNRSFEGNDYENRALQRIRNRLQLSSLVFEDSQHRIIAHEKNHLKMKYEVEEKQRKQMLIRICNNKNVTSGYGYLLLGQGN